MLTSATKSQKTSDNLGNLHVNDWQENKKRIRIGTLYLVFHDFQRSNRDSIVLKKQIQCNEPSFCLSIRPQNLKNKR